jgi:hypothetical protein
MFVARNNYAVIAIVINLLILMANAKTIKEGLNNDSN